MYPRPIKHVDSGFLAQENRAQAGLNVVESTPPLPRLSLVSACMPLHAHMNLPILSSCQASDYESYACSRPLPQQVTQLYRERIPAGGAVLDLCSSWVSHLPRDVKYSK